MEAIKALAIAAAIIVVVGGGWWFLRGRHGYEPTERRPLGWPDLYWLLAIVFSILSCLYMLDAIRLHP